MVLVDTSIWVDHFNISDKLLIELLNGFEVVLHPFILGELACGNISNRREILRLLNQLPSISKITDDEYFVFLEKNKLCGQGLGFIDIHLLASAILSNCPIYSRDRSLTIAAIKLGISLKK